MCSYNIKSMSESLENDELMQKFKAKIGVAMPSSFQLDNDENAKAISVVTVFGKSDRELPLLALNAVASATSLDPFQIGELLGDVLFQHRRVDRFADSAVPDVEACFVAEKNCLVVVVGLPIAFFQLTASSTGLQRQQEQDIFRCLTILFSLSHIAVCVDSCSGLSLRYVTILKALWQAAQKTSSIRSDTMKKLHLFPNNAANAGRLCVPRLLFVFDCRRKNVLMGPANESVSKRIRDMRHSLEDQTYRILRHAHVVHATNANKGLVAIPSNEEFIAVIVHTENPGNSDAMSGANAMLIQMITNPSKSVLFGSKPTTLQKPASGPILNSFQRTKDFIFRHVEQLKTENIRTPASSAGAANFHFCSLRLWVKTFLAMDKSLSQSQALLRCLDRFLFVNSSFAETLCKQALESAKTLYMDSLPRYYSLTIHEERLIAAREHFVARARNSVLAERYIDQLEAFCNNVFSVERRLCEQVSIFGSVCALPLHRLPGGPEPENEDEARLPVRHHACNIISKAACNCGRTQADRDDPFTSLEANYEFYQLLEDECCHGLQHLTLQTRKAKLKPLTKKRTPQMSEASGISEQAEDADSEQEPTTANAAQPQSPQSPSKTGSASTFWSLLSCGSFAVYNMNKGLAEYPGFVNGACFLYPIGIGPENQPVNVAKPGPPNSSRAQLSGGPVGRMGPAVVAYLGVEYECPKGHRFLIETPDKAQRVTQQSGSSPSMGGRGGGRNPPPGEPTLPPALCSSDIPLFFSCCACPTKSPSSGQLMRVYVLVPPQSPSSVGLSLAIRVQASQQSAFSPLQPDGAEEIDDIDIPLAPNNLWVLRFPLVYVNKNAESVDDQELPILPQSADDYANFKLRSNFLRFHAPEETS